MRFIISFKHKGRVFFHKSVKSCTGIEMVIPDDTTEMTIELIQPIAMEEGLGFAIREGGRTVGSGRVTKIIK